MVIVNHKISRSVKKTGVEKENKQQLNNIQLIQIEKTIGLIYYLFYL